MFNQKIQATENIEFGIEEELRYETDPCELKLDEMIEAEPEPEMIEGLPASAESASRLLDELAR